MPEESTVQKVETVAKADLAKLGGLLKVAATKEGNFVVQQYKMHPAAVLAVAGWTVAVGELLLLIFR